MFSSYSSRYQPQQEIFFKVVEGCLPADFCDFLIQISESIGFVESTLNGKPAKDFRNSYSCKLNLTNKSLINPLDLENFKKHVSSFCPKEYFGNSFLDVTTSNLNILKYFPGNYFKPHTDGVYFDPEGNRSKITVQIYLNDVEEGGETNFFDSNNNLVYSLKPKKGTVAFFDHTIMHEGAEVKKGVKYAFRVNAVYEKDKVNTFW